MKLLSVLILLVAYLQVSSAWVLQVTGKKEKAKLVPYKENFHSRKAENGCYNFSEDITDKGVASFRFCTIQMYMCEIKFFSGQYCTGKALGHNGGRGYSWHKSRVSDKGSKMKSFRISGCILDDIPGLSHGKFDKWVLRDC